MKRNILSILLIILCMSGCKKESEFEKDTNIIFGKTEAYSDSSKLYLDSLSLVWNIGDTIKFGYSNSSINTNYCWYDYVACAEYTNVMGFRPAISRNILTVNPTLNYPFYVAAYPKTIEINHTYSYYRIPIPDFQKYDTTTNCSMKDWPMVIKRGYLQDRVLNFKNCCGLIRLYLQDTATISSILLISSNKLSGTFRSSVDNTYPNLDTIISGISTIIMNTSNINLSDGKYFYFVVRPYRYSDFTIKIRTPYRTVCTKTAVDTIVIERNKITTINITNFNWAGDEGTESLEYGYTYDSIFY